MSCCPSANPWGDPAEQAAEELRSVAGALMRRLRAESGEPLYARPLVSVLRRLDSDGPMTTANLARAEFMTPQSMGASVAELEEHDLVARTDDPSDGRRKLVSLTREGSRALAEARADARPGWSRRSRPSSIFPSSAGSSPPSSSSVGSPLRRPTGPDPPCPSPRWIPPPPSSSSTSSAESSPFHRAPNPGSHCERGCPRRRVPPPQTPRRAGERGRPCSRPDRGSSARVSGSRRSGSSSFPSSAATRATSSSPSTPGARSTAPRSISSSGAVASPSSFSAVSRPASESSPPPAPRSSTATT